MVSSREQEKCRHQQLRNRSICKQNTSPAIGHDPGQATYSQARLDNKTTENSRTAGQLPFTKISVDIVEERIRNI